MMGAGTCQADHERGTRYTAAELAADPVARALASRCSEPEYKNPAVLAYIRATTGLNSALWASGWGLLFPLILLMLALGLYSGFKG